MKRLKQALPYIALLLIAAGGVWLGANQERALDWWVLRDYNAPAQISDFADSTAMTSYGERLFLVNRPSIDDKEAFNQNCAGIIEEVAVLGCYHGDRQGIYLYRIEDERLDGIEEVTAAHEMLHQAYDRLGADERELLNNLLQAFYSNELQDQDVREKLGLYNQDNQEELLNEMHSIFGTEIGAGELPDELEKHYSRYFTDRSKVVAFRNQSHAAFDEFRKRIAAYDNQLKDLQQQIENNESTLSQSLTDLEQERIRLDNLRASEQIEEYNAGVPNFNGMVDRYNALLQETQNLVEQYNRLVEDRNAVAVQVSDLNAALDSRLTPQ